jgi:hypothetical protein
MHAYLLTRLIKILVLWVMIFRSVSKIVKTSISLIISVCVSTWNNSAHTGQIFTKFEYFPKICQENASFTKIWQEQQVLYTKTELHFLWISFLLRMKMFQTKVVEKIKTHVLSSKNFCLKNCAVYEIVWKNTVEPDRLQMTLWCMLVPWHS